MNFLAHLYLSGASDEVKVGNFIGDYVKGNAYELYPALVRLGIIMHRRIDTFTDKNQIVKSSKHYFSALYHKYAGVIIDVVYDHFLAKDWDHHMQISLNQFVYDAYDVLLDNYGRLPERVQGFLPYFVIYNWLESYKSIDGLSNVLHRMSKKTSLPEKTDHAILILEKNYHDLQQQFNQFFPAIKNHIFQDDFIKNNCPPDNFRAIH